MLICFLDFSLLELSRNWNFNYALLVLICVIVIGIYIYQGLKSRAMLVFWSLIGTIVFWYCWFHTDVSMYGTSSE